MTILNTLQTLLDTQGDAVERWFTTQRSIQAPLIYNSVDLRHSGARLAPVDTNCYPAGFLNLSANARQRAATQLRDYLQRMLPGTRNILLVPENHTRNMPYLENLAALLSIIKDAGYVAELGSLAATTGQPIELTSPNGTEMTQWPLMQHLGRLTTESGFNPDVILLNNDLTAGMPSLLEHIAQPILPSATFGWWQRRKSVHFAAYHALATGFGQAFKLDPWLLSAEFRHTSGVDFKQQSGLDAVARQVEQVLTHARRKHEEYGIVQAPYAFIKADSGTYGMGIMTVNSPDDVFEMNKKERNKMHVIKEGAQVSDVIIQEGIPTMDTVKEMPAEPMIYLIDGIPVGGMWRVNGERDGLSNLNASGMQFTGMCDEAEADCSRQAMRDCHFHSYGLIAAIAALAAPREEYGLSAVQKGDRQRNFSKEALG